MKLLIAGAGGHGRVTADLAEVCGWSQIAFLDDQYPGRMSAEAWPIVGRLAALADLSSRFDACIAAFGDARLRLQTQQQALAAGYSIPVLVHPGAAISRYATLGAGTVVVAGSVVNIGSVVGEGCIINTGATVDHDCNLAAGVHVCPGAHLAGNVVIGQRTWFGIGAIARQGVRIGADVIVGAGAVCVSDVRDGATVTGVPARERKA